jgi:hypothetical protein
LRKTQRNLTISVIERTVSLPFSGHRTRAGHRSVKSDSLANMSHDRGTTVSEATLCGCEAARLRIRQIELVMPHFKTGERLGERRARAFH